MNCNCITEVEKTLSVDPVITEKAGEHAKATCLAAGIQLTETMGLRSILNIPFRITGTRKGYTTEKGKEMPVTASYCPFCGITTGRYVVGEYDGLAPINQVTEEKAWA